MSDRPMTIGLQSCSPEKVCPKTKCNDPKGYFWYFCEMTILPLLVVAPSPNYCVFEVGLEEVW